MIDDTDLFFHSEPVPFVTMVMKMLLMPLILFVVIEMVPVVEAHVQWR